MTSHLIWHPTFPLHLPRQAHKTGNYCKELHHTRHGPLAKQLPCCLKADAWIREAWHTKTRVWLNKGGGARTEKFNIPEARKPLKSGEPHEKQVPVRAHRGEEERLSTTITHRLVTGVKAARGRMLLQSWLLPRDKLQSAECPELQRESKWISMGQVSPQALLWCRIVSAWRWCTEMKAERFLCL